MKKIQAESRWRCDLQTLWLGADGRCCGTFAGLQGVGYGLIWLRPRVETARRRQGTPPYGLFRLRDGTAEEGASPYSTVWYLLLRLFIRGRRERIKGSHGIASSFLTRMLFASQTRMSANCAQPCVTRQLDCLLSETCVAIWLDM